VAFKQSQMMTQTLVPISLPIRLQCLCAPTLWRVQTGVVAGSRFGPEPFLCPEINRLDSPHPYDPWEKRGELFRLEENDNNAAAVLLNSVGFFEMPNLAMHLAEIVVNKGSKREIEDRVLRATMRGRVVVGVDGWHYLHPEAVMPFPVRFFWEFRRQALEEMKPKASDAFTQRDYAARFAGVLRLGPSTVITALALKDAVAASIRIDQLRKAKFKKCHRPDCGIPFAAVGPRKRKFCSWYCGHIVSVRKARSAK
jgi:hypothetical protein